MKNRKSYITETLKILAPELLKFSENQPGNIILLKSLSWCPRVSPPGIPSLSQEGQLDSAASSPILSLSTHTLPWCYMTQIPSFFALTLTLSTSAAPVASAVHLQCSIEGSSMFPSQALSDALR